MLRIRDTEDDLGEVALEKREAALLGERMEAHLEGEAPKSRSIDTAENICTTNKDPAEVLHLGQKLIGLRALPGMLDLGAVQEQTVGLVEEEDTVSRFGVLEGLGDGFLCAADPHGKEVRRPALDELPVESLGEVAGEFRLAGAGKTVKEAGHRETIARSPPLVERAYGSENCVWRRVRVEDGRVVGVDHRDGRRGPLAGREFLVTFEKARQHGFALRFGECRIGVERAHCGHGLSDTGGVDREAAGGVLDEARRDEVVVARKNGRPGELPRLCGEGFEVEREGEAAADGFMGEAEGVGDPEDRTGYGIEELVQVGLVREILALVVGAGVEEAVGLVDDEELSLAIDHARDQLEDESPILKAPLGEGDGEEARRLAYGPSEGLGKLRLAGSRDSVEKHVHGPTRTEESLQDVNVLIGYPEGGKWVGRLDGRRRVGRVQGERSRAEKGAGDEVGELELGVVVLVRDKEPEPVEAACLGDQLHDLADFQTRAKRDEAGAAGGRVGFEEALEFARDREQEDETEHREFGARKLHELDEGSCG